MTKESRFLGLVLWMLPSVVLALPGSGARDYANAPEGSTGIQYIYQNVQTNAAFNQPILEPQLDANVNIHTLRYVKYFGIDGRTSAISVYQAYGRLNGDIGLPRLGQSSSFSSTGVSDTVVIFGTNIFGAPYLPLNEFLARSPTPGMSVQTMVNVPTGSYDRDRAFNLGTNRWQFKPEIAYFAPLGRKFWWDLYGNVELFGDNDKPRNGYTLKTKPLYGADTYLSYTVNRAIWVGAGLSFRDGGSTTLDGIKQSSSTQTINGAMVASMSLSPNWSMKAIYTLPIKASSRDIDTRIFQLTMQYSWGFK